MEDDVICISFKRLPEGGYVALGSEGQPIKAFTSYQEMEWDTVMNMRRVCGNYPNDAVPKFMEQATPMRDDTPTQSLREPPKPIPLRERVVSMVSRAAR